MYERDYESVITSNPHFMPTYLISECYTVLKPNGGKSFPKRILIKGIPSK